MKVLIVNDYGTLHGGAEHMSVAIRDGLRERGHEALFLSSTARPVPIDIAADIQCFGTTGGGRKLLQVANPSALFTLRRTLNEFQPDIVHLRMFMTQLSPLVLTALKDIPTVHHVVNYDLICPLNVKRLPDGSPCQHTMGAVCHQTGCLPWIGVARGLVQNRLATHWLKNVDRIVCNSHWVRRRLEVEGVPVSGVIWNGIPARPARSELANAPLVACAARLFPKKGVDVLVRAVAGLKNDYPNLKVVIGGDGPDRASLQKLAADLNVDRSIEFLGHIDHVRMEREFGPAWVQVIPSTWEEPFGIVTVEAQMRGTAAIVSNVGGPTEIIEDGVTGLTFSVGDPASLQSALRTLLAERSRADAMGRAGRERALRLFDINVTVDSFVDLYREMLAAD